MIIIPLLKKIIYSNFFFGGVLQLQTAVLWQLELDPVLQEPPPKILESFLSESFSYLLSKSANFNFSFNDIFLLLND
ncbi:hypothetical protein EAG11_18875 [Flavobacterium sp. 140616W15]|nr:hypothetical protein EAG11_18875 [Flavobacterium sp. 140616W15]